jgi:peptide/nickel transport system substrate-binding protein
MKPYDRRKFLRLGLAGVGGLLLPGTASAMLEACGSSGAGAPADAPPRRGGSLTFATESEINSFDTRLGAWDSTGFLYARSVYDPLFHQAADGSVQPYLARSITPNADYTQWTITLRPGITFHDGSPLDANVVKVNLDAYAHAPLTAPYFLNVAGTKVVDPLTVLVSMYTPWVPFPIYLTKQPGYVAGLKQLADTSGRAKPIGTGPFIYKEWQPGDHFIAERNPSYWRPGQPYLDSIKFRPIVDAQSRGNSLLAGDVDLMHSSDSQSTADFMHRPGFQQVNDVNSVLGEPEQSCIMLNTVVAPLNDIRVRQALAAATNRQRVIDTLFNGLTRAADGPFVPGSPYYGPTGYPNFDQARARRLVADYEKEKGPIFFQFVAANNPKSKARNELLQAMWREVGIQTDIVLIEQSPLILNAIVGNFQATGWRGFSAPDPDSNYVWWSSTTSAPVGRQALNFTRINDPQIDAALDAGRTQVDPTVRAAAYRLVGARFGALVPYVWLGPTVWIVAGRGYVGGLGRASLPDGSKARPMISGVLPPAELWRSA